MKDKNNEINIEIKEQIETKIKAQNQESNNIKGAKSGGNTPSDLGAIKKPISQKGKRPLDYATNQNITSENNLSNNNGAKNNLGVKKRKQEITKNRMPINKNPILNQNRMKNFGKIKKNANPTLNPSASFFNNAKGIFNGKGLINKATSNSFDSLSSTTSKHSKNNPGIVDKFLEKKVDFNLFAIFNALPVHVKFVIVGGGMLFFLIFLILIIVIADDTSSADGNRDMKTEYIQGHYTEDELCKYLEKNNYISLKVGETCEDTKAYKFFVDLKEIINDYETRYERYRFQVNVELLYETLAYYSADEEMYNSVTKEEVKKLIEAMIEEIEETCVVKTYDKDKKICTEKKYVYTLYEFSLDKYISYLKYGETSTHPNYGHDDTNKSSTGKAVERKCGEGKNTDYIFGYGLVNTSSSPLSESSSCPKNPVTEEDYKNLPKEITTLEKLNAWGGVPKYSHIYDGLN